MLPSKSKVAILASGGLDSTVLLYLLASNDNDIWPIFINYGQHFIDTELESLSNVCPKNVFERLKIIDVSSAYTESTSPLIVEKDVWKDTITDKELYIPYRTLVILSVGMAYAQSIGCSSLYAGFIDSNYVKDVDCSSKFFEELNKVNDIYSGVNLVFPFLSMTKREVITLGVNIGAPIEKTFSCQITKGIPCGVCPNCIDRNNAFNDFSEGI